MGLVLRATGKTVKGSKTFTGFLLFILLSFGLKTAAQEKVQFKVVNNHNEPLPFATFQVLSVPDSSFKQQQVSDSSGIVFFTLQQGMVYKVRISAVNFLPFEKTIVYKQGQTSFQFSVLEATKTLGAVVVTSSRPVMRQEDDKTIVEPENLAASSTNAYEIMEKTPGLFVDQDGNIYLSSTTPATIYINGREVKMSTADIATLLKSLPPNAIASIEILRTPSARYDASGSGGIVNIVLKKGVKIGLTGSVYAGLQQGKYGNQTMGLNINNNNGKLTTYLNLNYSLRNTYDLLNTDRFFVTDSALNQNAVTKYQAQNYYLGFGFGYQFNAKWELNYDSRFSYNNSKNISNNESVTKQVSTGNSSGRTIADVVNDGYNYTITQGLNTKYKIDSLGSEWTTDLSFTTAPSNTTQTFLTNNVFSGSIASGDGTIKPKLNYYALQTNLIWKFPKKLTVETGIKTSQVNFDNVTEYYSEKNGVRNRDYLRTSTYRYDESINSGYLQASKTFSGITLKAGTRLEQTIMNGHQALPKDTSFRVNRTDFFPYVYLSRGIMSIAGYELRAYLVYRRTISRPAYEYLNPFPRYIDPYLFETGNPTLRPQFTHNYEANISVDERPIFAIGVNDTKDIFNQVVYQVDSNRKYSYRTYDNLGTNKETYFRVLGAIPPGKRYFFVIGAQYNHNFYNGLYQSKPLSFEKGSWTFFTYQTFKVTPLTQLTLNGFARFNGQQQFYELESFGALNLSLNQQLFKRKMTLTLSANDIFFTNNNRFSINQPTINAVGYRESDTRRFGINIRYNFGIRKKEEKNNIFNIESPEKGS